jgi:hypothetical protein
MLELTIKVKTSERTQTHKHIIYSPVTMSTEDKTLSSLVKEAVENFGEPPDEISLRSLYFW